MAGSGAGERLEPRLTGQQSRERAVRGLLTTKPNITRLERTSLLDQVKKPNT